MLELDPNKYTPMTEFKTFNDIMLDHFRKKQSEDHAKTKDKRAELNNDDCIILSELCNLQIGVNYRIERDSMLYKTLGSQSLNISVEVHSYLDKRLQVLLNIKLIFNESNFAQKEKGGDRGYAQKILSLKTRISVAMDSESVERIVNEKDAKEELLSDSLETHTGDGDDPGEGNGSNDFKRDLAKSRRFSVKSGGRQLNSDTLGMSQNLNAPNHAPTINELSASVRKNLMKSVTQCNNEFQQSQSVAHDPKEDRKHRTSKKRSSKKNKSSVQNSQEYTGPDSFGIEYCMGDADTPDQSMQQAGKHLSEKFEKE